MVKRCQRGRGPSSTPSKKVGSKRTQYEDDDDENENNDDGNESNTEKPTPQSQSKKQQQPPPPPLPKRAKDMLLVGIVHLRHYFKDSILGILFRVSRNTILKTRKEIVYYLASQTKLNRIDQFLSSRQFPVVRIAGAYEIFIGAIDGTEQPNTDFYSNKKKQDSITKLAIVSLNGDILYVSPSFVGSQNDNVLISKTYDSWKKLVQEHGYYLLGDNRFSGRYENHIVDTGRDEDLKINRVHSKYRVIIENFFGRTKVFQCLTLPFRSTKSCQLIEHVLEEHQQYWSEVVYIYFDVEETKLRK
eukprot:gene4194-5249_t